MPDEPYTMPEDVYPPCPYCGCEIGADVLAAVDHFSPDPFFRCPYCTNRIRLWLFWSPDGAGGWALSFYQVETVGDYARWLIEASFHFKPTQAEMEIRPAKEVSLRGP